MTTTRLAAGVVATLLLLSVASVGAVGQSNVSQDAPYYTNTSSDVNDSMDTWMENRSSPTLDNVTNYLTRIGTYVIGTGAAQGGAGNAGSILLGLGVIGLVASVVAGTRVGPVAGVVLGLATAVAVSTAGIAPVWLYGVMLFGLGLVATVVLVRALR